jgi:hypothetical protein
MQIYKVGPYDQHIMFGVHELTDDEQTLSILGILPGSLLTLRVTLKFSIINILLFVYGL